MKSKRTKKPSTPRRKTSTSRRRAKPEIIYAQASPLSESGISMFDAGNQINSETCAHFQSQETVIEQSVASLEKAGFKVLQTTQFTINFCGTRKQFEKAFKTSLEKKGRDYSALKGPKSQQSLEFWDSIDNETDGLLLTQGTSFENLIEGVAIEEPVILFENAFAPPLDYWHLDVPGDVSLGCNADKAHRSGITGKGIKVAMVDTGHYAHPFFSSRGYRVEPVTLGPGATNPANDEHGHGTAESANIFAVAPDVTLYPVKAAPGNSKAAFDSAVALNPDIITCSWGWSTNGPLSAIQQSLAVSVAAAVASGIVVIFSAGNGHFGFPGQHPDVISAGGVYWAEDDSLQASNYSSGFMSMIYPGRRVPDVCGLVGQTPGARYITLPVEPGDTIDRGAPGGNHPNGDETTATDGWASISGTSAAAPQLAGAVALIKQACSRLSPAGIRTILKDTAIDITTGSNAMGTPSVAGPDSSTGHGLVNAYAAVLRAKIRCLPIAPIGVLPPVRPITVNPISPPIRPIRPIQPIRPIRPILPISPVRPIQPIRPIRPIRPIAELNEPMSAGEGGTESGESEYPHFTEQELRDMQDMADRGEINLDDLNPTE